ncbi:MAG: phosphotransferase [Chloroflexi bacterium]|nr:phosphotransferase [Chloroflexota bacterium]
MANGHASGWGRNSMIPEHVRQAYRLTGSAHRLTGGSQDAYRAGDVVVKRLVSTSLENPHSFQLAAWLVEQIVDITEDGFRIARPVASCDGAWMTGDGWMAWTFIEGRQASDKDVPAIIDAVRALHRALRSIPKHPLLDQNNSAWGFAHDHCLGSCPDWVHPVLKDWIDALYAKRRPLQPMACQIIHGDLNHENILIAPGLPPGFIDLTPFWASVDFALAMFANWIGPRRGDPSVLRHFEDVPQFDQLFIRAAIRMLLVVSDLDGVEGWETSSEKAAAEIVLDYVS